LLLHALSDPRWKSRPLHVRFFGRGSYELNLRRLAERLHLTNIEFTGYVHDIDALWADHHALILPSRYEGLPLALVEAMWCGRTAIVTDVDGNSEMIEDGVQGFLAPAATAGFVEEALERAWQARERWQEMGIAARESVRSVIPRDPIATFATELLRVAGSTRPSTGAIAGAVAVGG
jgi:glycosyltransferase involved in cell wall biosynthesis